MWDNFHYQDEDEAYIEGPYATFEEALARAKQIVEESVANHRYDYKEYAAFGDDPRILTPVGGRHPDFEGRAYAAELCRKHHGEDESN